MSEKLKQRLVGIAVLGALAVIFIPMLLQSGGETNSQPVAPVPERPVIDEAEFQSSILPLPYSDPAAPAREALEEQLPLDPDSGEVRRAELSGTPSKPLPEQAASPVVRAPLFAWVVQVASFSERERAQALAQDLKKRGFPATVEPAFVEGGSRYRVRVGPELDRDKAESIRKKVAEAVKLKAIVVRYP